jgi:hypothetical protein
VVVEQVETMK